MLHLDLLHWTDVAVAILGWSFTTTTQQTVPFVCEQEIQFTLLKTLHFDCFVLVGCVCHCVFANGFILLLHKDWNVVSSGTFLNDLPNSIYIQITCYTLVRHLWSVGRSVYVHAVAHPVIASCLRDDTTKTFQSILYNPINIQQWHLVKINELSSGNEHQES